MVLENFIFTVKIVLYKVTVKIATTKNLDLKFYNKKHKASLSFSLRKVEIWEQGQKERESSL